MSYIDGFVIAVPTANKQKFIDHAYSGASDRSFRRHPIADSGVSDHPGLPPLSLVGDVSPPGLGQARRRPSPSSMGGSRARRGVPISGLTRRRAREGPVDARGRASGGARRSWPGLGERVAGLELAHRGAVEVEATGGVDQAVEDGVGEGGLVDHRVPGVDATPDLRLSETIWAGTPPNQASARPCDPIQSGRLCVQVASAKV